MGRAPERRPQNWRWDMGRTLAGPLATVTLAALVVSGCTSSRIGGLSTQPAPLIPAPLGTVTSGELPPPARPGLGAPAIGPDGFPVAPGQAGAVTGLEATDLETTDQEAAQADGADGSVTEVASATPVTREGMVGAWRVSTQGADCQMFMALTRWSTGFRAASRGCPGDAANVSSWNISGNRVVLSDSGGNQVAALFSSGSGRFDGQTASGRAISLAR